MTGENESRPESAPVSKKKQSRSHSSQQFVRKSGKTQQITD